MWQIVLSLGLILLNWYSKIQSHGFVGETFVRVYNTKPTNGKPCEGLKQIKLQHSHCKYTDSNLNYDEIITLNQILTGVPKT